MRHWEAELLANSETGKEAQGGGLLANSETGYRRASEPASLRKEPLLASLGVYTRVYTTLKYTHPMYTMVHTTLRYTHPMYTPGIHHPEVGSLPTHPGYTHPVR